MKQKEVSIRGFQHRMTYDEYQEIETTATDIFRHKMMGEVNELDPSHLSIVTAYPTVQDLRELDVFCHLSKYLPWLVYLDSNDLKLPENEYKEMKRYVRKGLLEYIILSDEKQD